MASILSLDEVVNIRGLDADKRDIFFSILAGVKSATVADIEKAYNEGLAKAEERAKANEAKSAEERRIKRIDTLRADVEAFCIGYVMEDGSEHDWDGLYELYNQAVELGTCIVLAPMNTGEDAPGARFTVPATVAKALPSPMANAVRGGGTGAGRPASDTPQPFVEVSTGKRVTGPVTMWLTKNVSNETLKAANLLKADGKLKASGSVIADMAVKAGILRAEPVPAPVVATPPAELSTHSTPAPEPVATPAIA